MAKKINPFTKEKFPKSHKWQTFISLPSNLHFFESQRKIFKISGFRHGVVEIFALLGYYGA
jgi:hypothetical protein